MAQESERAITPRGDSLPAWQLLSALGERLGQPLPFKKAKELRALARPGAAPSAAPVAAPV